MNRDNRNLLLMTATCTVLLLLSVIHMADYKVWLFEIFLGIAGVTALVLTRNRLRFSGLVYFLIAVHFGILAIAAKYTYANMPLFNYLRDALHLQRNYFDRVGHFFQGFVPALIVREVLVRVSLVRRGKMLGFLCICVCLAISAFWELMEWWVVVLFYPTSGPEWLGTQGDIWDAQQDMLMALIGATFAILLLSRWHDASIKRVEYRVGQGSVADDRDQ